MKYTPEQRAAIETTGDHVCVDAGAGSGKTRVLVDRVVHLIDTKQAAIGEVVAITFTEKAASELKERLRRACREKATIHDAQTMSFWRGIERQIDGARIGTIHNFCSGLLRENALSCGLDPDFTVLTDAESALIRKETATQSIHAMLESGDASAHALAVEFGVPQLIATIDRFLGQQSTMGRALSRQPLDSSGDLLDFWKSAVDAENEKRLLEFCSLPEAADLCAKLKALDGSCSSAKDAREVFRLNILDAWNQIQQSADAKVIESALRSILAHKLGRPLSANWGSDETFALIKALQEDFKKLAQDYLPLEWQPEIECRAAELTCAFAAVYRHCREVYVANKIARATMDFDDLIATALNVLQTNDPVREKTAAGIRHLLIDEFQDTDSAQLAIARLLMRRANAPGAELFIVGDAKQSIYGFRGAEFDVFAQARDDSGTVIPLDRNFRSVPDTLSFINEFFTSSRLMERGNIDYAPLIPHREAANQSRVEFLLPHPEDKENVSEGRRKEADLIAARLIRMCSGDSAVEIFDEQISASRPANFGDVAIIFRSTTGRYIYEECLRRNGVPFNVVAGAGFYERQEISDFINLLRVVTDPYDELALLGFLRSPIASLSDDSLMTLCLSTSLVQACASTTTLEDTEQQKRLERARALIHDLRQRADEPLTAFLRRALAATGYEAILLAQHHGVQKASNLRKLIDQAGEFSRTRVPRLRPFLRFLRDAASHELREGDAPLHTGQDGSVTLMTIHKAKGLEFPIVVVADASRKRNAGDHTPRVHVHRHRGIAVSITGPDGETAKPAMAEIIARDRDCEDQAEHARLLYVALTRARDWLLISGAQAKGDHWLSQFHGAFGLYDRAHDSVIDGNGWRAKVYRALDGVPAVRAMQPQPPSRDRAYWERRIRPVMPQSRTRALYSVSELLDIADSHDAAQESDSFRAIGAMERGILVHRLFEKWHFAHAPAPIDTVLKEALLDPAMYEKSLDDLQAIADRFVQTPLFARVSSARRIDREAPFLLALGHKLLSGTIDAIVDDALLIDYKTSNPRPELHARYETQLRIYVAAFRALRGIDLREAVLYYTDTGETISINIEPASVQETLAQASRLIESHGEAVDVVV